MPEPAPEVFTRVTRYEVSCLPPDHREYKNYKIAVERGRDGRWSASDGYLTLTADGEWAHGLLARHHLHDLDTALALAKRAAPLMTCNGHTVAEALSEGGDSRG